MNYLLDYPYGADKYIQDAQTRLYDYLLNRWGLSLTPSLYRSFGRVYRVHTEDGYIPQAFNDSSRDYISSSSRGSNGGLFFEDKLAVLSYVYQVDPIRKNDVRDDVLKVEWMFFIDLSKITPGGISDQAGFRLDEIAINDVKNFLQNNGCGFTVHETVREVDKVLERFSGAMKKNALHENMQPKMCFKICAELRYNPQIFTTQQQKQLQPMQKSVVLYIKTSPDTSLLIPVGDGLYMYQEYAAGNTLKPLVTTSSTGYLAGKNMELPFVYNEQNISLPDFNLSTGVWDRTGLGVPTGFQDGDIVTLTFTDQV
ncbi:MAG: hypothetical protein K0Q79_2746 [Flavipsychrobacter sp.]|jgi:hypothetical protein|nr:hypothetical protein [Flavipsychrobacter sp.]